MAWSVLTMLLVIALFQLGIFNPFRIYRHVSLMTGHRKAGQLDFLESHLSDVDEVIVFMKHSRKMAVLKPREKERVLTIVRRLGPYSEKGSWMMQTDWICFSFGGIRQQCGIVLSSLPQEDQREIWRMTGFDMVESPLRVMR